MGVAVCNSDVRGTQDVKKGQDEQKQLHKLWTKDERRVLVREGLEGDSPLVLDDHIVLLTCWGLKRVVVHLYLFDVTTLKIYEN